MNYYQLTGLILLRDLIGAQNRGGTGANFKDGDLVLTPQNTPNASRLLMHEIACAGT